MAQQPTDADDSNDGLTINIDNRLQAAEVLTALRSRRDDLEARSYSDSSLNAVNSLIEQLEGTPAHEVIIGGDDE